MDAAHLDLRPPIVPLDDHRATDADLVGAKAASLARAWAAGLPVLPGFVLSTAWTPDDQRPLTAAWQALSEGGRRPLVVRSSSTAEDGAESSMAGLFTSVLDVRGPQAFAEAVEEVLVSRTASGLVDAPMGVLVQPFLDARWGGVLFSADPITGRTDRVVVSAVRGGPDALVSGQAAGWTAALTRRGRIVEVRGDDGPRPSPAQLRALARLARSAERAFGSPQDIEWAVDEAGTLRLLQSRPITTLHGPLHGPMLGTGPVAETFPDALAPLEADLWLEPLRDGLREALALTGAAAPGALRRSPVVVSVDGWAAADLEVLGATGERPHPLRRFDPRPPARRLRAAWRVGRLTAALPALARDVAEQVDADLAAVPQLDQLGTGALLAVLDNGREALAALHGYEALAGLVLPDATTGMTAASVALSTLAQARDEGVTSEELLANEPVVLALLPPRIGGGYELPEAPPVLPGPVTDPDPAAVAREALRLRARWVHELTAQAALELGRRLTALGVLTAAADVRLLTRDELAVALADRLVPADLAGRAAPPAPPPPARFRLAADGTPLPVSATSSGTAAGAGGGVGRGPVHVGDDVPAGTVLVVSHLDPRLAPVIPRLAGLVAETGSPLSHLAILAREYGVPTVVGHAGATTALVPGDLVEVDGGTGSLTVIRHAGPQPVVDLVEMGAQA